MRPWYMPPANGDGAGGPRNVKCHSNMLVSRGAAWKSAEGEEESSAASRRMRLIVGDLVLKVGAIVGMLCS